jgi:hypothetical protein
MLRRPVQQAEFGGANRVEIVKIVAAMKSTMEKYDCPSSRYN